MAQPDQGENRKMRRRPNICDACSRLRRRMNPDAVTSVDRYVSYCAAFPHAIPTDIYLSGFDHRDPYPGDRGIRFEIREGAGRAIIAFEHRSI